MRIVSLVRLIAIISCGLMTGILLGDRIGLTYARPALPPSSFVVLQQVLHLHFSKVLPVLLSFALAGGISWMFLTRSEREGMRWWLLVIAVSAMATAAVFTIRVNFPINDQLMTWSPMSPPGNCRQIWSAWENAHSIRTVLWVAAFTLEVTVLSFSTSRLSSRRLD